MDVTKQNFEAIFPIFEAKLNEADFIAIDLEMSGIRPDEKPDYWDLPALVYQKIASAPTKYGIIQVGLTTFTKTGPNAYEACPFNFFTFPRPFTPKFKKWGGAMFLKNIQMDNDCIDFHLTQATNFQRWICDGITYFDIHEVDKIAALVLSDEEVSNNATDNFGLSDSDLEKLHSKMEPFVVWQSNLTLSAPRQITIKDVSLQYRKWIYNNILNKDKSLKAESIEVQKELKGYKDLIITRLDAGATKQSEIDRDLEYNTAIGFSRVWSALTSAKKPTITHNGLLDYLFMYTHFQEPLPRTLPEFKAKLNLLFPKIYDTKSLAGLLIYADDKISDRKSLQGLYEHLKMDPSKFPTIVQPGDFNKYEEGKEVYHEAAFDALQTGACYIALKNHNEQVDTLGLNRIRMHNNGLYIGLNLNNGNWACPSADFQSENSTFIAIVMKKGVTFMDKKEGLSLMKGVASKLESNALPIELKNVWLPKSCNYEDYIIKLVKIDAKNKANIDVQQDLVTPIKEYNPDISVMTLAELSKFVGKYVINYSKCAHWEISQHGAGMFKMEAVKDVWWLENILKATKTETGEDSLVRKCIDWYSADVLKCMGKFGNFEYVKKVRGKLYADKGLAGENGQGPLGVKFVEKFKDYHRVVGWVVAAMGAVDSEFHFGKV